MPAQVALFLRQQLVADRDARSEVVGGITMPAKGLCFFDLIHDAQSDCILAS
jgi:hypothetical protein